MPSTSLHESTTALCSLENLLLLLSYGLVLFIGSAFCPDDQRRVLSAADGDRISAFVPYISGVGTLCCQRVPASCCAHFYRVRWTQHTGSERSKGRLSDAQRNRVVSSR
eukprot:6188202-Pleurochrysis_carterae.AAC.2